MAIRLKALLAALVLLVLGAGVALAWHDHVLASRVAVLEEEHHSVGFAGPAIVNVRQTVGYSASQAGEIMPDWLGVLPPDSGANVWCDSALKVNELVAFNPLTQMEIVGVEGGAAATAWWTPGYHCLAVPLVDGSVQCVSALGADAGLAGLSEIGSLLAGANALPVDGWNDAGAPAICDYAFCPGQATQGCVVGVYNSVARRPVYVEAGSTPVDSGVDAADAADAADSGSPPGAISAVYPDLGIAGTVVHGSLASCAGCTTGNTTATLCGTAATLTAISGSSFTLTAPANSAQNSCNLVLTNAGGSSTASAVYTQSPAGLVSNWDMSCGVTNCYTLNGSALSGIIDQQNGYNAVQATGANQPTSVLANYNASGFPAGVWSGAAQGLIATGFTNTAPPLTVCIVADAPTSSPQFVIAGNAGAAARISQNAATGVLGNDGSGSGLQAASNMTAASFVCFVDNGASSALYINNVSAATGSTTSPTGLQSGVVLGNYFGMTAGITSGHVAQALVFTNVVTFPNAVLEAYAHGKWKTP